MHEHDPVRRHLASLGEPPVPADLWTRIDARRTARVNRRRAAATAVGALALVAIALPPMLADRADVPAPAAHPVHASAPAAPLRAIDRELQLAYDRGAPPDEIAALWVLRQAAAADPASRPTRI